MSAEHFNKAYTYFSNRCSKKELSAREVMIGLQKYQLKLSEKHKLINRLKKDSTLTIIDMPKHLQMIDLIFTSGEN